jgi:hypothetical protein
MGISGSASFHNDKNVSYAVRLLLDISGLGIGSTKAHLSQRPQRLICDDRSVFHEFLIPRGRALSVAVPAAALDERIARRKPTAQK